MALNIKLKYSEEAEASALAPMLLDIVNDDCLPLAFKLNTKHPHRYVTNMSHGIVQPKKTKVIQLRLRPPHELKDKSPLAVPPPVSILKGSSKSGSPRSSINNESSSAFTCPPALEITEILRLEIRVITGVIADPATEQDFAKYWPTGFHHSTHMVPFKVVFLSEEEYFQSLLEKQDAQLKEAELEREALQESVRNLSHKKQLIEECNEEYSKDLVMLRKRTSSAVAAARRRANRIVVPIWVGLLAVAAAGCSAVLAAGASR